MVFPCSHLSTNYPLTARHRQVNMVHNPAWCTDRHILNTVGAPPVPEHIWTEIPSSIHQTIVDGIVVDYLGNVRRRGHSRTVIKVAHQNGVFRVGSHLKEMF